MTSIMLLRPKEVADALGLSKATLAKWRVHGDGPAFIKVGTRVVYAEVDIQDWLADRRQTNTVAQR
ncbi:helix-turn-helix transcriptional regulator [Maricaulis sp.]|uniref:helix-turn-helix transcriptional regulator n=1 Tax=Maricaulis sp. TaxID=1486257 RepID=UPI003A90AD37